MIRSAISEMDPGSVVVAAFDNDPGSDELTSQLLKVVEEVSRNDLEFKEDRPLQRGADWNQVLMTQQTLSQNFRSSGLSLGQ